jgi:nitrogen fixation/metabolism regulation signal transduction histidine kinase
VTTTAKLLSFVVIVALGIVVFVVLVGGIVCISDKEYDFGEYLKDLNAVYKLFLTAVLGILARAVLPMIEQRSNGKNGT